jgi:hypothetical protein
MRRTLTSLSHRGSLLPARPRRGRKLVTTFDKWDAQRIREDVRLYELYGRPLEQEHAGEFIAIGPDGQIILGDDDGEVLQKAIETFGSGNFAFTRVGDRTLGQWLVLSR